MDLEEICRQLAALPPAGQRRVAEFITLLQERYKHAPRGRRGGKSKLSEEPFIGLWEQREDLRNSTAWVRDIRRREWGS
jgi:hypothetical protein